MVKLDRSLWLDLIGAPFKLNGRGPDHYDCFGLLIEIFRRRGIEVPNLVYGADEAEHSRIITWATSTYGFWTPCKPQAGAALVFRQGNAAQHCGVALDEDRFIHATADHKAVRIDKLDGPPPFRSFLLGAYEHAV